ncbi:dephospho-CoA kinase [Candidatus Haliotispira prima]|uniref:Dephospho-CoA kinase n=1 Tax=Candidatus Haliotispira prima TaxID=3034016 RepID=A0ABY8MI17_9SPIO|nr:dephospho-CoA kinase [Candidatus Haliotispira prima]
MLIGITGKSCSGKDFLSAIFQNQGCREINLDAIGHMALEHNCWEIVQAFPELADRSGPKNVQKTIDRKKLGDLVFRNPAALHKLEGILHPWMRRLVLQELESHGGTIHIVSGERTKHMDYHPGHRNFILNAAILEKLGLLPLCDLVLWVESPLWLRVWRARQREQISLLGFLRRNRAQRGLKVPSQFQATVFRIKNAKMRREDGLVNVIQQLRQIPRLRCMFESGQSS